MAWVRRTGDLGELVHERVQSGLTVFDRGPLVIGERDGHEHALEVLLGLEQLELGGVLRDIEVAASARHPMRALLEEGVAAEAVTEVIVLPRLTGGHLSRGHGIAINEDFDGP